MIKIFADFNNTDSEGRVRLNNSGTLDDLDLLKITLEEGLKVLLDDSDGLKAHGIIQYSKKENIWVAKIENLTYYND